MCPGPPYTSIVPLVCELPLELLPSDAFPPAAPSFLCRGPLNAFLLLDHFYLISDSISTFNVNKIVFLQLIPLGSDSPAPLICVVTLCCC